MSQVNTGSFRGAVQVVGDGSNNNNPRVKFLSGKKTVVTWVNEDSSLKKVYVREIDTDFSNLGTVYSVGYSGYHNYNPEALYFQGVQYIIAWAKKENSYSYDIDTYIQLYEGSTAVTSAEQLLSDGQNHQHDASMVKISDERVVVAWNSDSHWDGKYTIEAKIYEVNKDNHHEIKDKKNINIDITSNRYHRNPLVAAFSDGKFVLVWEEWYGSAKKLMGQIFKSDGNKDTNVFQIRDDAGEDYRILVISNNNLVISWTASDQDGKGIYAEIINQQGNVVKSAFQVNTNTGNNQYSSKLISSSEGFSISWLSDGSNEGINLQRFDINGEKIKVNCPFLKGGILTGDYDVADIGNNQIGIVWTQTSQAVYMGVGSYNQLCDITASSTVNVTDSGSVTETESLKISDSNTVTNSLSKTESSSKSSTKTETETDSITETRTGTVSASQTKTDTQSESVSDSSTKTGTISDSRSSSNSDTGTESKSKSYSDTKSATTTDTDSITETRTGTVSASQTKTDTQSESVSDSSTKTGTVSDSRSSSNSDTGTESKSKSYSDTKSATITDTVSMSDTSSGTVSVSQTKTDTQSESVSNTLTHTGTESKSSTQTTTATYSSSESNPITETSSISIKCDMKEANINLLYDDLKIKSINPSSGTLYEVSSSVELRNSFTRKTVSNPKLVIDHEIKDFIVGFRQDIPDTKYIIGGRVGYSNQCINNIVVDSSTSSTNVQRLNFNDAEVTSYDWYTKESARNFCLSRWNISYVEQNIEVPLDPGQCVVAKMTASYYKDVEVQYDTRGTFTGVDKFGNKMQGDALQEAADCIVKKGINWKLIEQGNKAEFYTSGIILHNYLHDVKVELTECSSADVPAVYVTLTYRDFNLQPPTDLSAYAKTLTSTKDFVNAKDYGITEFDAILPMNIMLTNKMTSFHDDIKSNNRVLGGKVTYLREYTQHDKLLHSATITGYKVDSATVQDLEYDWFTPKGVFTTNILSQWNTINLEEKLKVPVAANGCASAQIKVSMYKDVPVPYTATAYVTMTDIDGYPLVGDKLKTASERIFFKTIMPGKDNEVTFNVNGILSHNILTNVETAVTECSSLSTLQSSTKIPMVHVSLTYRDFNLVPPTDLSSFDTTLISSERFVNAKDQGVTEFNPKLQLNVELMNNMTSFHDDIKSSDNVLSGSITYLREYTQHPNLIHTSTITGYKVSSTTSQDLRFDWFTPKGSLTTNILSQWDSISLEEEIKVPVSPNKCVNAQVVASMYKDIPVDYTATAYVTMTDIEGNPILGNRLSTIANSIFSKTVASTSRNNEVTFGVSGTLNHNIIYNVETSLQECSVDSVLQSSSQLPKVHASLTYSNFVLSNSQNYEQNAQTVYSSKTVKNNKQYGIMEGKFPIALEVNCAQSIDSFTKNVDTNNLVIDGEVRYIRKFDDIQDLFSKNLNGYTLDYKGNDDIVHPWYASSSEVSSGVFTHWSKLKAQDNVDLKLVPNQCVTITMTATLYKNVEISYTAEGHFTARNEEGYPVQGNTLGAIADQIFTNVNNKALNSQGEIVFDTTGTLTLNLLGDVQTAISDC